MMFENGFEKLAGHLYLLKYIYIASDCQTDQILLTLKT